MITRPYIDIYDDTNQNRTYKNNTQIEIYVPTPGIMIPKDTDYDRGYYYRYFFRLSNDKNAIVFESDEKEYKKLQNNAMYKILKIKWKLIGPQEIAKEINTKIINTTNEVLFGIKSTLIDPLQFWKNLPDFVPQFDVTNKLPKMEIKKKRYNSGVVSVVGFDTKDRIYILTDVNDIIYI